MPKVLKHDVTINFKTFGWITIPKGTQTTNETASGIEEGCNYVNQLGWIDRKYPAINKRLKMAAIYYGINIPEEHLIEKN